MKNLSPLREPNSFKFVLIVAGVFLTIGVLLPLCGLANTAFRNNNGTSSGLANFVSFFKTPSLAFTLWYSFATAATTAVITVAGGFVYAYSVKRSNIPFRTPFRLISLLPLFAPSLMHGISLIYLLGNKGLITGMLNAIHPGWHIELYGFNGIVLAQSVYVFPQMVLLFLVALDNCDGRLYESAEILGAGSWRRFFTITMPSVREAVWSGLLISFTLAFTDFGAAKIVGGQYTVLSVEIYKRVIGQMDFAMGSVVSLLLMLPAFAAFLVTLMNKNATVSANAVPLKIRNNSIRDTFLFIATSVMAGLIILIMGTVVFASLVKYWPYNLSFTFAHYDFKAKSVTGFDPFLNSVSTSFITAVIGTAIVFVLAYTSERMRSMQIIRKLVSLLATLPTALPGLVIGLSYIIFFNTPSFSFSPLKISFPNPFSIFYGTIWILVLANIIHFLPVCYATAVSALKKCNQEFESFSASMGVHPVQLVRKVILPITAPALIEILLYLFVNAMITVSALIFLVPAAFKVASVAVIDMDDAGDTAEAAAMSVLIVVVNLFAQGIALLIQKLLEKNMAYKISAPEPKLVEENA